MKVAIIGNGAIGNLLALNCTDNEIIYTLIKRDGQPFKLHCTEMNSGQRVLSPSITKMQNIKQYDLVVLPLKAYQIIAAIEQMSEYLTTEHVVVLLHNGMGTIEKVRSLLPNNPLIAATTSVGAFKPNSSSLVVTGNGLSQAGWINTPAKKLKNRTELTLNKLLLSLEWHIDVSAILWRKLAINAAINPLTALFNVSNGELLRPEYSEHIENICHEVSLVMNALGYQTSDSELIRMVRLVATNTATNYSSMNRDMQNNRTTEIEFINGYVVAEAQRLGIAVPFNKTLQERVASNQKFC
jgi:2-dehydropantoate 2-reductase